MNIVLYLSVYFSIILLMFVTYEVVYTMDTSNMRLSLSEMTGIQVHSMQI